MIALTALLLAASGALPSVDEVMKRVAENQDKAVEERRKWSYRQSVRVRLNRGNGRLARMEDREYFVTPGTDKVDRQLVRLAGKIEDGDTTIDYTDSGFRRNDRDIDGELIEDFSDDVMGSRGRDGMDPRMFPLTAAEQPKYSFQLKGEETYQERPVYRIEFKPVHRASMWEGEALIDAREFQPVMITTRMARGIPIAVRVMFGVSIQNVGFKVTYKRLEDGVWFPATFGTEFKMRMLFFYSRKLIAGLRNEEFRKTDVSSRLTYQAPQ